MAIVLPQEFFVLPPSVGKSYFEDLTGGTNAIVTVQNNSTNPVNLVITRVDAPVITYLIPAENSLSLAVDLLLVAALLTTAQGAAFGSIQVALADF